MKISKSVVVIYSKGCLFQDFSEMLTKCLLSCDMLFNFPLSQKMTIPTKKPFIKFLVFYIKLHTLVLTPKVFIFEYFVFILDTSVSPLAAKHKNVLPHPLSHLPALPLCPHHLRQLRVCPFERAYHVLIWANKLLDLILCKLPPTHCVEPTFAICSNLLACLVFLLSVLVHDVAYHGISIWQLLLKLINLLFKTRTSWLQSSNFLCWHLWC